MNRDDIIRMAREAGFTDADDDCVWITDGTWDKELCKFAELIAAAERKAVLETIDEFVGMERDRNTMFSDGHDYALHQVKEFVLARGRG